MPPEEKSAPTDLDLRDGSALWAALLWADELSSVKRRTEAKAWFEAHDWNIRRAQYEHGAPKEVIDATALPILAKEVHRLREAMKWIVEHQRFARIPRDVIDCATEALSEPNT
jgi:hypothetical protein